MKPKIALIGVGEKNMFGHPSQVTLDSLTNCGSRIYRTDRCGEITITISSRREFESKKENKGISIEDI